MEDRREFPDDAKEQDWFFLSVARELKMAKKIDQFLTDRDAGLDRKFADLSDDDLKWISLHYLFTGRIRSLDSSKIDDRLVYDSCRNCVREWRKILA